MQHYGAQLMALKIKKAAFREEYNLFTHYNYNYNTFQKVWGRQ